MWKFKGAATKGFPLDLSRVSITPFVNDGIVVNRFDCGREPVNRFLKSKAKKTQKRSEYRTFCAVRDDDNKCLGYYSLQVGADAVPDVPKHKNSYVGGYVAFPAVNLSFLGVDSGHQEQGLGKFLLQNMFERVVSVAEHVGFYAVTVQAIDMETSQFYERLGFEVFVHGPQPKLLYPLQDIRLLIDQVQ